MSTQESPADPAQPHILMCPPDFFGVHYEINPWMSKERQVDQPRAAQQWNELRSILVGLGARVSQLAPVEGLPDLVFTANAALIHNQRAILSRFHHVQRQGEEEHDQAWLEKHGFNVEKLPESMYFEGAGDALFCGESLFAGYRIRSDAKAHQRVGQMLDCRVIPLELVDDYYYHIDTCFCPLRPGQAIFHPAAFDSYGRRALREMIPDLIAVDPWEAKAFCCNAVVVGKTVVTNAGCPTLHSQLRERGFDTVATPLDEFVKAGGSAKCLTLRLDGEEGASWRNAPCDS